MLSKLDRLKQRVTGDSGGERSLVTSLYYLIKELKCLPDIVGREYEVDYKGGRIVRIRQLPIKIPTLISLFKELETDYKKQERKAKKMKGRRR